MGRSDRLWLRMSSAIVSPARTSGRLGDSSAPVAPGDRPGIRVKDVVTWRVHLSPENGRMARARAAGACSDRWRRSRGQDAEAYPQLRSGGTSYERCRFRDRKVTASFGKVTG